MADNERRDQAIMENLNTESSGKASAEFPPQGTPQPAHIGSQSTSPSKESEDDNRSFNTKMKRQMGGY